MLAVSLPRDHKLVGSILKDPIKEVEEMPLLERGRDAACHVVIDIAHNMLD